MALPSHAVDYPLIFDAVHGVSFDNQEYRWRKDRVLSYH
jgi:hypothetical protein